MTTLRTMTQETVNAAEPLTFPVKRSATIRATYHGVAVDVQLDGAGVAEVERVIDGLLSRDGWSARTLELVSGPTAPAPPAPKARRPQLEPTYLADGSPCCPHHGKALAEGRYGLYCPSKAEGELANAKGYCTFTVKS